MQHRSIEIIRNLHPVALDAFRKLSQYLESSYEDGRTTSRFLPFEGLRSPIKQEELFRQRPPVTHVGAWHSAHQYGLAVDFVPVGRDNNWSWAETHEWSFLRQSAALFGLRAPFDWDKAHVEHPLWTQLWPLVRAQRKTAANDNSPTTRIGDPVNDSHKV